MDFICMSVIPEIIPLFFSHCFFYDLCHLESSDMACQICVLLLAEKEMGFVLAPMSKRLKTCLQPKRIMEYWECSPSPSAAGMVLY